MTTDQAKVVIDAAFTAIETVEGSHPLIVDVLKSVNKLADQPAVLQAIVNAAAQVGL